jgi:hypothetical protein
MKKPKNKVAFVLVCALILSSFMGVVSAQSTEVRATVSSSQPKVGDTLTVNITISNVVNLFGVDVILNWNTTVLKLVSSKSLLGVESHPEGVLHETASDPIYVAEDTASQELGQYSLVATSAGSASAFSGSGIIAVLTFNVTSQGATGLSLESELSDKPATGQNSNFITHTDTVDTVTAVPEYSGLIIIASLMTLASVAVFVSKKRLTKNPVF